MKHHSEISVFFFSFFFQAIFCLAVKAAMIFSDGTGFSSISVFFFLVFRHRSNVSQQTLDWFILQPRALRLPLN